MLLISEPGPLRQALQREAEKAGQQSTAVGSDEPDLFGRALDHRAIVYAPAPTLLKGKLEPEPDRARVERVLRASNAPGVRVLVALLPEGDGYALELDAIREFGTPYVVLTAPPLLEEIADAMATDGQQTLWLPARGGTPVAAADAVAQELIAAIDTEWQGRVLPARSEFFDPVTLARRAAGQAGLQVRVRRVWTWVYRFVGLVRRWLRARVPATIALAERLFPELGSPAQSRQLPAGQGCRPAT